MSLSDLEGETRRRHLKLYRAALNGDWEVAGRIYDDSGENIGVRLAKNGDTALHIAAAAKRIDFVKKLVAKMSKDDLAKRNEVGSTALFFAAASGKVELAQEMMNKNQDIAMIPDDFGTLPIELAAALGHKEMVNFLYQEIGELLGENNRQDLFINLIEAELYDTALQLLDDFPELATARASPRDNEIGVTALHVLASKHPKFSKYSNRGGIFKRCFNCGARDVEKEQLQAWKKLVERIWRRVILLSDVELSELIANPKKLIFDAAERGNVDFLSILICEYPDLIWKVDGDENTYSIFHIAVKNRQADIFKLIYEIESSYKDILLRFEDSERNNILHLAGKLASSDQLNIVSGAALQMQRELFWFKKVEEVVQRKFTEARNTEGWTPRALFTEKHKELRDKGEKWMKDTATACMLVATLIATVVFAAAFTVPGGPNQSTGFPIFLGKSSFKIFAISDAVSLVSSSLSVLNFLSILTSPYAEEDFLWMLPRKLRTGLATLFISIAAMMVAFSTTFFIFFKGKRLWIAILITAIAATPVIMFIWQHFQLFYDVLRSTYASDSLFQKGKSSLFRKEGEANDQQHAWIINASCTCSTNV
ncbi:Ankyrin repeat family protein [Melia azedarach]|uniref:Ankyrin repeat family protein n=1 Tax=Melia azedarach TaxID=155640 RepID=A0ACC1WTE0_MELAZ|nr:Ankyrin repeat family protein [Melia azedarach]